MDSKTFTDTERDAITVNGTRFDEAKETARERRAELAKMNLPALRQEYRERVGYPAPRGWNKADLLNYFAV